jgi:Queuosine biosynthesis protein QueC
MREQHVFCGPGRRKSGALHIDVDAPAGSPNRVNLRVEQISRRLADNIPDVLTDLLELAAYAYCADQFTTRGTSQMTAMGADWRRRFHFQLPVRRLDVWTKPEVYEALCDTLGFVSDDEFQFEFRKSSTPLPLQSYLSFEDPPAQTIAPDEIILFSGGLDSLAGAVDAIIGAGKRVALVSHQGSKMITSKQNGLIADLRERTQPGSLFFIPVAINKGQEEAAEFTQRTRSFMFATLGLIVARMFGRNKLSFYENGVVSINLPIAGHVIGARASRTTHPGFLAKCSRLFSLLLSSDFSLQNPYLWKTKSEVVRVLAERQSADLISNTFSCTRVREATKRNQHCGVCSQCVDRRFGILAAGLSSFDPTGNYAIDLFTGAHEPGPALTMIECYVLRAQKLATMSQQAFVSSYGQVFRAVEHLPGIVDENVRKIWDLHSRHGGEVVSIVDREIESRISLAKALDLPTNSLLSLVLSPIAKQPNYVDPVEEEPTPAEQAKADPNEYKRQAIEFAIDDRAKVIVFRGGFELGGGVHELIARLVVQFEAELDVGTFPEHHKFVRAGTLANYFGIDESSLRKRISRARKALGKAFLEKLNRQLVADDIIENQEWKGYRLNPYLLLMKPAQLREPRSNMSQVTGSMVTSQGTHR